MSTITSSDGSLTDLGGGLWKKTTAGVEFVTLSLKYTKVNSTSVTINALRVPHTGPTKKVYIGIRENDGKVPEWQCYRDESTSEDGITIVVGCSKSDIAVIFKVTVSGTDDAVIDLGATINSGV